MNSESFLNTDLALHANFFAALKENRAEVLFDSADTLLIREKSGVCFLSSRNEAEAEPLLRDLYDCGTTVVLHGTLMHTLAQRIGFEIDPPCTQVFYEGALLPEDGELTVRHPDSEDFSVVAANYDLVSGEWLRYDFEKPDFLGGYLDGKLVCFTGLHSEGSMGMLTVLPEYRRRGFAQQIYSSLINNQLRQGRIAYAQVYTDNASSLALQKKLGFRFAQQPIWWSWNPNFEE